jgi:hypothetical protein
MLTYRKYAALIFFSLPCIKTKYYALKAMHTRNKDQISRSVLKIWLGLRGALELILRQRVSSKSLSLNPVHPRRADLWSYYRVREEKKVLTYTSTLRSFFTSPPRINTKSLALF